MAKRGKIRARVAHGLKLLEAAANESDDSRSEQLLTRGLLELGDVATGGDARLREVAPRRPSVSASGLLERMGIDRAELREAGRASDSTYEFRGGRGKPLRTRVPKELDETGDVDTEGYQSGKATKRKRKAAKDGRLPIVRDANELAAAIEEAGSNPSEKLADHLTERANELGQQDQIPRDWPRSRKAREAVAYAAGLTATNPRARGGDLLERAIGPGARDDLGG